MDGLHAHPIVSGIFYYPVKSLAGISVHEARLTPMGLEHDRLWMLAREDGRFITQREEHSLALLSVIRHADGFKISAPSGESTTLPLRLEETPGLRVQVWKDELAASMGPAEAADFFSDYLGFRCIPVFRHGDGTRFAGSHAPTGTPLSFADAYPALVISEASVADLNTRTSIPIVMKRFRPNIVVSRTTPYAEDTWAEIAVGTSELLGVKPCDRCVLTTVDPETGVSGKEPLKTLAAYRRVGNDVYFGQNLVVTSPGTIKKGDTVTVRSRRRGPLD